jgi:nucleoside-diphosphate-sugar epimerase
MQNVLVTGATSYPGLALTGRLLAEGAEVHAVVRPTSDLTRLSALSPAPAVHVHDATAVSLRGILERVRPVTVYHVAAMYRREHSTECLDDMVCANIGFGAQLLEAMASAGVRVLVNTGSFFQNYQDDEYRPLCLYAAMKESFRVLADYYRDTTGLRVIHLKLFEVYGPGDWRRKFVTALGAAQATGEVMRMVPDEIEINMVYIDDVVDAFLRAGEAVRDAEAGTSRTYAVRTERDWSLGEIVRLYERVSGKAVPVEWGAVPLRDREIAKPWQGPTLPGWTPRVSLEEGLARLL